MKKLVITLGNDYNKTEYMVNENMIKTGINTCGNQDFFTNATTQDFENFNGNEEYSSMNFTNYIEEVLEQDIEFVWEGFYTKEEIKDQGSNYTNVYDSNSNEIITIDEYFDRYETEQYLEYWDGSNWRKESLEGISSETYEYVTAFNQGKEVIENYEGEKELSEWQKFQSFNYELYKCNDNYYLVVNSYYQGKLDYIECLISESELKDRFDYVIEQ